MKQPITIPAPSDPAILRHVDLGGGYRLITWEVEEVPVMRRFRTQTPVGYALIADEPEPFVTGNPDLAFAPRVIFAGEDFGCSPCHAIDSNDCLRSLLGFLTLKPGDTDTEYFANYTAEQMAFAKGDAEELSLWSLEPENGCTTLEFVNVESE